MLKPFKEMAQIDVSQYCSKRDGFLYLNWAKCIELLHQYGAEKVEFLPVQNEKTGGSLLCSEQVFTDKGGVSNRCYETRIQITIDDDVFYMQSPVMNGQNPVKDNSMNQARVWNSMCRSFVKGVALHTGLGFNLWLKEETRPFNDDIPGEERLASTAQLDTIKSICKKHGIDGDYWVMSNGRTWETLTADEAGMMLNTLKERYGDD